MNLRELNAINEALALVFGMRHALRRGGKVVVLTQAELREVRLAAGQATDDADWYKHQRNPRERRALLSAADKLGFPVVTK